MILPIVSFGHPILKKKCEDIDQDYPHLESLIETMWETLYKANGCGLSAPQVNLPVRIFLVDSIPTYQNLDEMERGYFFDGDTGIREVFINARIVESTGEQWVDKEGCLSIPGLQEDVERPWTIRIDYYDKGFNHHTKAFSGLTARMIQHEYDHIEGILYLDHLAPIKRTLLKGKLRKIAEGKVKVGYPMKFIK